MTTTTESVQYGAKITHPNGSVDYEPATCRSTASLTVSATRRDLGEEAAVMVWRPVTTGPWRPPTQGAGNEWGVRMSWVDSEGADPIVEVHPAPSRRHAERMIQTPHPYRAEELVTRQVTYGDWTEV